MIKEQSARSSNIMRLGSCEQKIIKKAFLETFEEGKIYLFGNRDDDTKKDGDIDLYYRKRYRCDNIIEIKHIQSR